MSSLLSPLCRTGTLPEQGSPALASIMAQISNSDDDAKEILGEKGTYAIDASGQTGEVSIHYVSRKQIDWKCHVVLQLLLKCPCE